MDLQARAEGENLLIRVRGDLDLLAARKFREQVEAALDRSRAKHLVLDLQEVPFIDSSGLGAILGRFRRIRQWGGRVVLVNPAPTIRPVLEMAGFYKLMEVRESGNGLSAG